MRPLGMASRRVGSSGVRVICPPCRPRRRFRKRKTPAGPALWCRSLSAYTITWPQRGCGVMMMAISAHAKHQRRLPEEDSAVKLGTYLQVVPGDSRTHNIVGPRRFADEEICVSNNIESSTSAARGSFPHAVPVKRKTFAAFVVRASRLHVRPGRPHHNWIPKVGFQSRGTTESKIKYPTSNICVHLRNLRFLRSAARIQHQASSFGSDRNSKFNIENSKFSPTSPKPQKVPGVRRVKLGERGRDDVR